MGSWFGNWMGAVAGSGDTTAPTVTKVSPAAFNPSYSVAQSEPVVVDITDATPGLGFMVVTSGDSVVYYGTPTGAYGTAYLGSTVTAITNGYRLSILPADGWSSGTLTLTVAALDSVGNLTTLVISLMVPAADQETIQALPLDLRDSVWRWRRRLRRQKCSVVSIAIDDNYSDGPGFVLTALSLEIGRKKGLDRTPARGGTNTNSAGSGTTGNGR